MLDIETFPNISYTWGKYDQNVIDFQQESCIATYAAKWYGEKKVFAKALPDYDGYKPMSYDDGWLVADLQRLLDEADIAMAHNGDAFDFKVITSRMIFHRIPPPSPYKTIDTKKLAKESGRFNSNKLDDLGRLLGEGKKIKTDFGLWLGCMTGDPAAWARMVRYNKQDVRLLERVYDRLKPYAKQHPNLGAYLNKPACPRCGSMNLQARGKAVTIRLKYQRFQCMDCGSWCRSAVHGERSTNLTVA